MQASMFSAEPATTISLDLLNSAIDQRNQNAGSANHADFSVIQIAASGKGSFGLHKTEDSSSKNALNAVGGHGVGHRQAIQFSSDSVGNIIRFDGHQSQGQEVQKHNSLFESSFISSSNPPQYVPDCQRESSGSLKGQSRDRASSVQLIAVTVGNPSANLPPDTRFSVDYGSGSYCAGDIRDDPSNLTAFSVANRTLSKERNGSHGREEDNAIKFNTQADGLESLSPVFPDSSSNLVHDHVSKCYHV
jgi:hypothetical protein